LSTQKVSILTYNVPHRKTFDTLSLLKAKGFNDVNIIAIPFHYLKKFQPHIQHRPSVVHEIQPEELCKNLGYSFQIQSSLDDLELSGETILICGAGIIPEHLIDNNRIINSHPAILPLVRGLDALKWSLYNGQPLGVTSHIISKEADAGFLIDQQKVEVQKFDTFHSLAYKLYELEIKMLVAALDSSFENLKELKPSPDSKVNKRMSNEVEEELFQNINGYLAKYL
jgi:methionyl-tRNA formyltransferase